jgi:hypothetical protein
MRTALLHFSKEMVYPLRFLRASEVAVVRIFN